MPKSLISRDVVFKEDQMYIDSITQSGDAVKEKPASMEQVELEIEIPISDQVVESERTDQGEEESESDDPGELQNY